jgi:hypothetical protein
MEFYLAVGDLAPWVWYAIGMAVIGVYATVDGFCYVCAAIC